MGDLFKESRNRHWRKGGGLIKTQLVGRHALESNNLKPDSDIFICNHDPAYESDLAAQPSRDDPLSTTCCVRLLTLQHG